METIHVDRDKYDVIEESKKIDEIHEGIKQFQKECQNAKTNEEKKNSWKNSMNLRVVSALLLN